MKVIVLLNRDSGTVDSATATTTEAVVADAMATAGIEADIRSMPHNLLAAQAREAAGSDADIVVAGGGDGTVNTVAAALAGTDKRLGVLPLGTLNHFARDLGLPLDLAGAVAVIAAGHTESIDVGRVNDSVFINNSSIGMYSRTVLVREAQRRRGWSKWLAMTLAMLKVFRRFPMLEVRLTTGEAAIRRRTPLVFVGNDRYEVDLFTVGTRELWLVQQAGRWRNFGPGVPRQQTCQEQLFAIPPAYEPDSVLNATRAAPAATRITPPHCVRDSLSCRKIAAKIATSRTLDLSIGSIVDA